jgi:hypothetical protein
MKTKINEEERRPMNASPDPYPATPDPWQRAQQDTQQNQEVAQGKNKTSKINFEV